MLFRRGWFSSSTSAVAVFVYIAVAVVGISGSILWTSKPTFTVDYERNEFLMDGQVFRYISGSLHYFRVPKAYWKDRIQKMKAAGLNTVSTYVEWSLHEPRPDNYNFEDMADLEHFLQLIKDEGMYVLLRPGPYICAERDFGGFPYWLLNVVPRKRLRTNDPSYKHYITKWFNVLMPKIDRFLYGNGGNIIMVQVENEYGSYNACDQKYMLWLRDLFKSYVGYKALLYTTDGCGYQYFTCGSIPEVYATVDFGASTKNVSDCFKYMRKAQNRGPLVNSEFYVGWLAYWQRPVPVVSSKDIARGIKDMLALNASINFYMFHGGTNFGFTAGANKFENKNNSDYMPQLTSYDYDAPLNEAGDPTEKYFVIKKLLEEVNFSASNEISPVPAPKGNYGKFVMRPLVSLFEKVTQRHEPIENNIPLSFEKLDVDYGFVMYETILTDDQKDYKNNGTDSMDLVISVIRDRAIVYLDQKQVNVIPRKYENTPIKLNVSEADKKLSILIENQGRINYGSFLEDRKGIFEPVKLGSRTLGPWKMIPYTLNETSWLSAIVEPVENVILPAFYRTRFAFPNDTSSFQLFDTYLDTTGWHKGVAFVNGINIGRYWSSGGPQINLYVPATFLVPPPGENTIVMLELEGVPDDLSISLTDKPNIFGHLGV
ncbi:Glycoside hydrolase superfamily,Beta-galactosidase 1-like,Glycoside hydrolase, family [Cinara cedri]|uniref:Glycoside hydrolase superfamily,Beta-galactosidase 1-like,Glycoside hydrolase, family n=1 Tax=Cinara cedri TaxID=506608 RepID=A0A5E4ML85_9HEMI|nr:Glycoside hydrolase superfamily,Beta-galactosidase 1-like,Glycoside hydrolase, family [Cinara cedri]